MKGIIPHDLPFPDFTPKARSAVLHTAVKMWLYFSEHDNIMISVSGGSDSDCIVHLVCKYFPEYIPRIHFVFVNTGLEYQATKNHLDYIENRYGIKIDRIRGKSVVWVCKEYGFPILSKNKSWLLYHYIKGNPCGEKEIFSNHTYHSMQWTDNQKRLAMYLKSNGFKVSRKCCDESKKKPLMKYQKENSIDLYITGERKAEGGQRTFRQNTCYNDSKKIHKFMPLFFWDDDVKAEFKEKEKIIYSDCYEKWGMKRTGCVGCPFNLNIKDDLQKIKQYEPQLYNACMHVFGLSYFLTDLFSARKKKCLTEQEYNDFLKQY